MHELEGKEVQWIKSADQAELRNLILATVPFNKDLTFSLYSASTLISSKEPLLLTSRSENQILLW